MTDRPLYVEFGRHLRELREKAGLTQQALARSIGLTRTSVTNIEAGRQAVDLSMLYALADALKVWPADLLSPHRAEQSLEGRLNGLPQSAHVLRFVQKTLHP